MATEVTFGACIVNGDTLKSLAVITVKLKKEFLAEQVTALIDTREQAPLNLSPLKTELASLPTGDYSVRGLENIICVERKSLQDLMGVIGRDRERFEREVQRLLAYPVRALVVEAHISQIELKQYRGDVHPNAALGSVMGWMARGLPIIWAGSPELAGRLTAKFLYTAAKRRYLENYTMMEILSA